MSTEQPNLRVLVIDDTAAIHEDFRKALGIGSAMEVSADEAILFGDAATAAAPAFEMTHAMQGQEGYEKMRRAAEAGQPFAVAFVDMRMPPGWDGMQTIEAMWKIDPDLQIVICTAYSDYTWDEIVQRLGRTDRLLVLRKPFDRIEVCQIALATTEKWRLSRSAAKEMDRLDQLVQLRTSELEQARRKDQIRMEELEKIVQQRTAELRRQAMSDRLTGLANRSLFSDQLEGAIAAIRASARGSLAVLFLDFDGFKVVNDSLGHFVGDQLLIRIAERLQRTADRFAVDSGNKVLVARLGGDEFVILIESAGDHGATRLADVLLENLAAPYMLNEHEVHSSASIGITTSEHGYTSATDIIRDADLAMYRAKSKKGCYVRFDPEMHKQAMAHLTLSSDLRRGIEREEFYLNYQPVTCLVTGRIRGFEALLRWRHHDLGQLPPDRFIKLAEETGYIATLGDWVLQNACKQLAAWSEQFGDETPYVTVNVSPTQFADSYFPMRVRDAVAKTGINPASLGLEITESAICRDPAAAVAQLNQIRALGVQLYLDDFGVAYSSLGLLPSLPLHGLKIDRQFVSAADASRTHAALVQAIINLAANLNLRVIGEGVETASQVAMLQTLDCGLAQGYFFSRPVDAEAAAKLITDACMPVGRMRVAA